MVTAAQFIEKVKIPLDEQWGYIYGQWGAVWTEAKQAKDTREMTVKYGSKWIGRKVTDCSGLLRRALYWLGESIVHHARYQYTDYCGNKGKLVNGRREDGSLPLPGSAVFLQGSQTKIHHVGVYIGGDTVIEAKGTIYGVVTSHLNHWDHWGELKMVDYTDAAKLETTQDIRQDTEDNATAGTILKAVVSNPNQWLNVRSNAGSQYQVVFQVEKGTTVEVLDAGEPEWWQIRFGGRIGWAFSQYLKPTGVVELPPDDDTDPSELPQEAPESVSTDDPTNSPINANKAILDALDAAEKAYNDAGQALARLKGLIKGGVTQ